MSVDFPRPDSPWGKVRGKRGKEQVKEQTDDHGGELETLANALPVDLVWKICETDVSHEFLANDWGYTGSVLLESGTGTIRVTVRVSHLSDV